MATGNSGGDTASRAEELKWALKVARDSIVEADADKRSPLLAQFRGILSELAEIEPEASVPKEANGLVVLQEELKRRQSGSSRPRSSTRRIV
jgi:hypothetical protein